MALLARRRDRSGALGLGLTGIALGSGGAKLSAPMRLVPGAIVTLQISGFPAGEDVRVEFGVLYNPPANCCASPVSPPRGRPPLVVGSDGTLALKWRVPATYAQCIDVPCSRQPPPNNTHRYRAGQRVQF